MYKAEVRARSSEALHGTDLHTHVFEEFEPKEGVKPRFWNALIPILVIIGGTVFGLLATGHDPEIWNDASTSFGNKLSVTIGNSDSYKALLWASLSGLVVAIFITILQRIMTLRESVDVSIEGFKTMVNAIIILILAWSLASITDHMHTADYLAGLASGSVSIWMLPAITFLISALVAFSTGSSWGTMAIVYPLMLPLSWSLGMDQGVEPAIAMALFLNVTSCVLSGSVLGDHCSPISDTTILSSLATQCDHLDHVKTQMPYALTVGLVAVIFTTVSTYFGMSWYLTFPLGIAVLYAIVHFFGKEVPLPQA
jgi:Na+/H+ antiporter NhaC